MVNAICDIRRIDLHAVNRSLSRVERNWPLINKNLADRNIGARDTPFDAAARERMLLGYGTIDQLLVRREVPFSNLYSLLEINEAVLYGSDAGLRREYRGAIEAAERKFHGFAPAIGDWYQRQVERGVPPLKIAAGIYQRYWPAHSFSLKGTTVPGRSLQTGSTSITGIRLSSSPKQTRRCISGDRA